MSTRRLTIAGCLTISILIISGVRAQSHEGRLVSSTLHSEALEKNLLGDAAEVELTVYLPPSYEGSLTRRYPGVYLLHRNGGNERSYIDGFYEGLNIKTAMDAAISSGSGREFIVVMPGCLKTASWPSSSNRPDSHSHMKNTLAITPARSANRSKPKWFQCSRPSWSLSESE